MSDLKKNNFLYDIDVIKDMENSTDKVNKALKKLRDERYAKLYEKIIDIIISNKGSEFELMIDQIQQIIIKTKLKLTLEELKTITSYFHNKIESAISDDRERLDFADKFFIEIDHANNQVLNNNKNSMRLFYT